MNEHVDLQSLFLGVFGDWYCNIMLMVSRKYEPIKFMQSFHPIIETHSLHSLSVSMPDDFNCFADGPGPMV